MWLLSDITYLITAGLVFLCQNPLYESLYKVDVKNNTAKEKVEYCIGEGEHVVSIYVLSGGAVCVETEHCF